MRAFQVALQASRRLRYVQTAAFVWLAGLWLLYFQDGWRWGGLLLTLGLAWLAWRPPKRRLTAMAVDSQGRASLWLQPENVALEAQLQSGWVSPWLMLLHWQVDGRRLDTVLLPDMMDAESWRRLQVWANWGRRRDEAGKV